MLLLSRKGAKKEYCPSCHSGVRVQVEEPPSKKSKKNNGGDKASGGFAAGDSGLRSRSKKNGGRDERDMAQPLLEEGLQRTQSSSGSHAASYTSRPRSPMNRGARGTGGGGGGGSNPLAASPRQAVSAGLGSRAASMPATGGEWTEHVTDSGVLYYHNAKTNETRYVVCLFYFSLSCFSSFPQVYTTHRPSFTQLGASFRQCGANRSLRCVGRHVSAFGEVSPFFC